MGLPSRILRWLAVIVSAVAVSVTGVTTAGAAGVSQTAIPYLDTGYTYQVVDRGELGSSFADPTFDDSAWSVGDAGFGTIDSPGCTLNTSAYVKTIWTLNTDILVRKHFTLPPGANNLKVSLAIDNDAQVFVNGTDISNGVQQHEGCPVRDSFEFTAPDSILIAGDNVVAVRGIDRGGSSYLDLQVTFDAPTYQICPLTDATKAHKSGSTVPIKLQLCDADGNNISSPDIIVQATGVTLAESDTSGTLDDSGRSNSPGFYFRYDPNLEGYIFNLSTKGDSPGKWQINFTVNGESQSTYEVQFVVR